MRNHDSFRPVVIRVRRAARHLVADLAAVLTLGFLLGVLFAFGGLRP